MGARNERAIDCEHVETLAFVARKQHTPIGAKYRPLDDRQLPLKGGRGVA